MPGINVSIIDKKFQSLLRRMKELHEENINLKEQLQSGQEEISRQQQTISEMEHKMKLIKMTSKEGGEATNPELKKEMRATLNAYIREIDNCIAHINK